MYIRTSEKLGQELSQLGLDGTREAGNAYSPAEQARCKERFETFRKSLAQPVRDALNHRQWDDAVSLAIIHNGLRDKYKLADMIYLEQYGPTLSYCKIKKGDHIPIGYYNDILINLVMPRIKNIPARQLPQEGGVDCVAHQKFLDKSQPDNPIDDLTGRYEGALKMIRENKTSVIRKCTFLINQAGKHIECSIVRFYGPKDSPGERPTYDFYGDQKEDGSFSLISQDDPNVVASLQRNPQTRQVMLASSLAGSKGGYQALTLIAQRPTIPEQVLVLKDIPAQMIRRYERYPLQRAQAAYIMERMLPEHIEPLLKKYFSVSPNVRTVDKIEMRRAARPMMNYMEETVNHPSLGTHKIDLPLAQYYAQTVLANSRWEHKGIIRSHLDWIQIMVGTLTSANENPNEAAYISDLTGVRTWKTGNPDADQKPYKYKITLDLYGGGIILQGNYGKLTVEQIAPAPWPGGKESFSVFLGGFTVKATNLGHTIVGEAESYLPWDPPDFPGTMNMVKGEVDFGLNAEAGWMFLYGSETKLPLQVLFSKASIKPKDIFKNEKIKDKLLKLLLTIDLGGVWGKVLKRSFSKIDYSTAMIKTDYAAEYQFNKSVHFCLDSALLTPAARQALRIMCAIEQAAFQSPTSHLTIIAHTDCSGPKDHVNYNIRLSNLRAQNTLQAIRDILGTKYAIHKDNEIVKGEGEALAAKETNCKPEFNSFYRRVDIILNRRLVLTLKTK